LYLANYITLSLAKTNKQVNRLSTYHITNKAKAISKAKLAKYPNITHTHTHTDTSHGSINL